MPHCFALVEAMACPGEAAAGATVPSNPSSLEYVFGFTHEAFREYMFLDRSRTSQPNQLAALAADMAAHDHPVVVYAAGSAFAEAALHRPKRGSRVSPIPYATRLQYLDAAQPLWLQAIHGFQDAQHTAPSEKRRTDFWSFEMRARQASAYIASMRLAAAWLGGHELPPYLVEQELQQTKNGVIKLARMVHSYRPKSADSAKDKKGIGHEILSGLLIQTAPQNNPPRYLIAPAPLRLDHHTKRESRADLLAVSAMSHHPKLAIQVAGTSKGHTRDRVFGIDAYKDLALEPDKAPLSTLLALIKKENGITQDAAILDRLDELTGRLFERLLAYEAKNTPPPRPTD